ncbi:uncharacterized protein EDB91DRAFT_1084072 [Suillus paluster]|uniref:uncharacterized protein n=1 Tax=Suillus paluster TaxID=48578 RepID=UPI001B86CF09|nr:uncharacterized protein EDB91DRAFT_1084072 [Suillus paluster]KAG1734413.1 hypothetical protein EDB91DRAFT_1084072 [Suillus paluster]
MTAGANIKHPGSEEELEVQVPGTRKTKGRKVIPVKTPVRNVIEAAGLIDESKETHDYDNQVSDVPILAPKKFQLSGHIPDWGSSIPTGGSKPSSNARPSAASSIQESTISSSAPSSKLTRGTTISSSSAPLTSISSNFDAGADKLTGLAISTLFDDNDLDESGIKISPNVPGTAVPTNLAQHNANLAPKQLDVIEPDIANDGTFMISNNDFEMDTEAPAQAPLAPLIYYESNSDTDSDLEPPPSAQVPKGYYDADPWPPPLAQAHTSHPTIPATRVKRKFTDIEDTDIEDNLLEDDPMIEDDLVIEDDLLSSSKVEFFGHHKKTMVKTEPKPVSLRVTSGVTGVGVNHKAPMAKRPKPSIKNIQSVSSITTTKIPDPTNPEEVIVEILPCSHYRITHLPGDSWHL